MGSRGTRTGAALLFACLAVWGGRATAQPIGDMGEVSYATPQHFAAGIKFGPYTPSIDSEFPAGTVGPYERYFHGDSGLMTQLEFEYQFLRRFGKLGVGLGLGYFSKNGHSFPCESGAGATCEPDLSNPSGDETSLNLMPFTLFLVYRFDVLAERYRVPLVPYARFGLTYSLWWVNKGNGKVAEYTTDSEVVHGRGGQFGLTAAGGAALLLDLFDPGAARELDGMLGINHTYLFWEWVWSGADGFGASDALRIGDQSWLAGLAFEF